MGCLIQIVSLSLLSLELNISIPRLLGLKELLEVNEESLQFPFQEN